MGSPTLLIGYDLEETSRSNIIVKFLNLVPRIHVEYSVPATFFIQGKTLLYHLEEFKKIVKKYSDLIDIQQHAFSHLSHRDPKASLDDNALEREIEVTSDIFKALLGVNCIGLGVPGGSKGFKGKPESLKKLWEYGIRFVRSLDKDEKGNVLSLDVQPFWYDELGPEYPPILEYPVQGGYESNIKMGLNKKTDFVQHIKNSIDYIVEKNLTWCYVQHAYTSFWKDPKVKIIEEMITYALDNKVSIRSYTQYYYEKWRERKQ